MQPPTFIVEHLESELSSWLVLEYENVYHNTKDVLFTNITKNQKKVASLPIMKESVATLGLTNACVLDPHASTVLRPDDKFTTHVVGGLLGRTPPQKRTRALAKTLGLPVRSIGPYQLSVDTTVLAAKIIRNGTPADKLSFKQGVKVTLKNGETVLLPHAYLEFNKEIMITPGIQEVLERQKGL